LVFLKPKPLTIEGWGRGGGGFLVGSSLPNYYTKGLERQDIVKTKERKQNQGQIALDEVREKQNIENNNLYDACSNALKTVQFYFMNQQLT